MTWIASSDGSSSTTLLSGSLCLSLGSSSSVALDSRTLLSLPPLLLRHHTARWTPQGTQRTFQPAMFLSTRFRPRSTSSRRQASVTLVLLFIPTYHLTLLRTLFNIRPFHSLKGLPLVLRRLTSPLRYRLGTASSSRLSTCPSMPLCSRRGCSEPTHTLLPLLIYKFLPQSLSRG